MNVNPKTLGDHWLTAQVNGLLFVLLFLDFNLQFTSAPLGNPNVFLRLSLLSSRRWFKTDWTSLLQWLAAFLCDITFREVVCSVSWCPFCVWSHTNVLSYCVLLTKQEGLMVRFHRWSQLKLKLYIMVKSLFYTYIL